MRKAVARRAVAKSGPVRGLAKVPVPEAAAEAKVVNALVKMTPGTGTRILVVDQTIHLGMVTTPGLPRRTLGKVAAAVAVVATMIDGAVAVAARDSAVTPMRRKPTTDPRDTDQTMDTGQLIMSTQMSRRVIPPVEMDPAFGMLQKYHDC